MRLRYWFLIILVAYMIGGPWLAMIPSMALSVIVWRDRWRRFKDNF